MPPAPQVEMQSTNPIRSPIQSLLERVFATCAELRDGEVATYIPELAKADPDWFGISLATTDGHIYEVGDTRQLFTIQSISKPFVYGLALEDHGRETVLAKIGVEPTGDAFNSISLAPGSGCPLNPMINAGAIAATSLIAGHSCDDKRQRLLAVLSTYAGRALHTDDAVYESERATGHRNRAIGYMLRNFDIVTADPEPALDLYFQQCSVAVDCRDLSVMAATLANGGVNPISGQRAVQREFVDSMLSVMTTCGMYDYAGEWVYWVGMPAKSGVAGGVLAVLPGQLGFGVFSPRLDPRGNSVRGVAVCKQLSRELGLHCLRMPRPARSVIRTQHSLADISSKRLRSQSERQVLDRTGQRVWVFDLQGDLVFSGIEHVVRTLVEASDRIDIALLDLKRVAHIDSCAATMVQQLLVEFANREKQLVLVNAHLHERFLRALQEALAAAEWSGRLVTFADLDSGIEWCENRLIATHGAQLPVEPVPLAEHQACRGLSPEAVDYLAGILERRAFAAKEMIIRKGDPGDGLYLLMAGRVSVMMALPNAQMKRLSTFCAGMVFGELAVIDRSARTADVYADTPVECCMLSATAFDQLGESQPRIKVKVLENLLRQVSRTVGRLNQEVSALSR